ncbi:cytosine deaminase [Nitratireductor sp. XY-223]|uniref:cytosine deaminase n=1 Tax=Nitratireductor sp. XY-223 TaxID=2561926 RepID=UPI0010A9E1B7|nr:cytosine deaminase [Nitratireductor sp. XY-223]
MFDLIIRNATLQDGRQNIDIACREGKIVAVASNIDGDARDVIDAEGFLVTPPFVDAHFHLDGALTHGNPMSNQSGELYEGINIWNRLKDTLTAEEVKDRARRICLWALANGTLHLRAQTDICDPKLRAIEALIELRDELRPLMDLQIVAFPQDGYLRTPGAVETMARAIEMGVDVVGGIPDYELTAALGQQSVRELCELAHRHGLLVDMHTDQTPDPQSRQVETLTAETIRLGLGSRVSASHCPSLANFDDYYANKLMAQMAVSGMNVVVCPLTAATCWGVMTRVGELYEAGVNIAFGYDCVLDPWYPLGTADILDVAHMAVVFGRLMSATQQTRVFESITYQGAKALGIDRYGIAEGCNADLVLLQARNPIEAIRLQPPRLAVVRRGKIIATQPKRSAMLLFEGDERLIDFTQKNLMDTKFDTSLSN